MRTLGLFWLTGLVVAVRGQGQLPFAVRDFGAELPQCAQECIVPVLMNLGHSNTTFSDLGPLLCHDIPHMVAIAGCLQTQCNFADRVVAWPFQKELCRNEDTPSRSAYIRNLTIMMTSFTTLFLCCRYYSRMYVVRHFWWDDGNMLVTAACLLVVAVVMIWSSTIGLGLHTWEVEPRNVIINAKIFFVMKLFYVFVQNLVKVSILLCYLRSFPVEWMQKATWALIYITLVHGVAFSCAILFQCTPVARLWDHTLNGHCIRLSDIIRSGAIFSMVEDACILILPIPCLANLNVGRGKRVSLILIFSVGFIATLISIMRAKPVWLFRETLDQTWDSVDLLAWSEAEIAVACICVCLPSMKPILNRHLPRYFGPASTFRTLESPNKKPSNNTDEWLDAVVKRGLALSDQTNTHTNSKAEGKGAVTFAMSATVPVPPSPIAEKPGKGSVEVHRLNNVRGLEIYRADEFEIHSVRDSVIEVPSKPKRLSKPPALPKLTFLRDDDSDSD